MSVLDKELLLEPFSPDRAGNLAFRAYVAALAASHVTRSDGTLRFDDRTLRWDLLKGQDGVSDEDLKAIRSQLEALELVVPYASLPQPHAFVPKWWRYNTRPDKARRAARTPAISDDVLERFPMFAEMYRKVPFCGEKVANRSGVPRKSRGVPGKGGNSPPPDPDPAPEPVPVVLPVPAPGLRAMRPQVPANIGRPAVSPLQGRPNTGVSVPPHPAPASNVAPPIRDAVFEHFLTSYLDCRGTTYRPDPSERGKVVDLLSELPGSRYHELLAGVDSYIDQNNDATLGGFCEWFQRTHASPAMSCAR
jgi:hypothetical protein